MSLRHIISSLRFSRLTAALLVLQTALACAVICNVLFLIAQQAAPISASSGVAVDGTLFIDNVDPPMNVDQATGAVTGGTNAADLRAMEENVRALPGVKAVSVGLGVPYSNSFSIDLKVQAVGGAAVVPVSAYGGDHLVAALGLDLVEGRDFSHDEISALNGTDGKLTASVTIISRALAKKLFGSSDAIGKRIRLGHDEDSSRPVVIGVVSSLPARNPVASASANDAMLLPVVPGDGFFMTNVVVRTQPGKLDAVVAMLPARMSQSLHLPATVSPSVRSIQSLRDEFFGSNKSAILLLTGVTLVIILVTVIGVMGITGFWVQRRTKQIGIRRALGATRADIARYFLVENFIVVGVGVMFGVSAAYGGNIWLMEHLEISRLPARWLLVGALLFWLVGFFAAILPARRAASIEPITATRAT